MTTDKKSLFNSEELFRPLDSVCEQAKPLEPLWGYYLYKKAITSIIADPGTGKTTFGYKLGIELALNHPFLGIYPEEEIKVLYMDLESSDALVKSRKILVSGDTQTKNITIYNAVDYYFPQVQEITGDFCKSNGINLVILDNQTMAFATRDENDNSEASRQMKLLRQWTNDCNVALVLVHHTSKANMPGTRKGTGAYARARLADILINFEAVDVENEPDLVCFSVSKNRMVDDHTLWYLKKVEGNFEFTEPPLMAGMRQQTDTKIYEAQKQILEFMQLQTEYKFEDIALKFFSMDSSLLQHALKRLYQQGRLYKPKYGFWSRKT